MSFNTWGSRVNFSLQVMELLLRSNEFKEIATWSSNNPSVLNITIGEEEKSQQVVQTLQQITVKVASRYVLPKNVI